MSHLRPLLTPLLDPVDRFAVQSNVDAERLVALGVGPQRVTVTGNLKFDTPHPAARPDLADTIRQLAAGRPIFVAGSTMAGEDESVLEAFQQIGGGERALLILAPRHPERWDDVAGLVVGAGLSLFRRSHGDQVDGPADVVLLDTLGELATVYGYSLGCFVGGTLVPTGGHNPLEPAVHGVAICVGPSMENFRDMAAAFEQSAAWCRVDTAASLAREWDAWLHDPERASELGKRAREVVAANQGSLDRTLAFLRPIVPATSEISNPVTAPAS